MILIAEQNGGRCINNTVVEIFTGDIQINLEADGTIVDNARGKPTARHILYLAEMANTLINKHRVIHIVDNEVEFSFVLHRNAWHSGLYKIIQSFADDTSKLVVHTIPEYTTVSVADYFKVNHNIVAGFVNLLSETADILGVKNTTIERHCYKLKKDVLLYLKKYNFFVCFSLEKWLKTFMFCANIYLLLRHYNILNRLLLHLYLWLWYLCNSCRQLLEIITTILCTESIFYLCHIYHLLRCFTIFIVLPTRSCCISSWLAWFIYCSNLIFTSYLPNSSICACNSK